MSWGNYHRILQPVNQVALPRHLKISRSTDQFPEMEGSWGIFRHDPIRQRRNIGGIFEQTDYF